jgi:hypothetical protein
VIGKWGARILTHISRIDARAVGVKFQATLVTDDTNGQIRGRELRREVRGKGREERICVWQAVRGDGVVGPHSATSSGYRHCVGVRRRAVVARIQEI